MGRRWIVGAGFGLYAVILLASPYQQWTSETYEVAWDLAPRWAWAVGFAAVAVTAVAPRVPQWAAGALLAGHCAAWSGTLLAPLFVGGDAAPGGWSWLDTAGRGESVTAWIWPAMLCAFVLRSAAAE